MFVLPLIVAIGQPPTGSNIVNGSDASECQFPSIVVLEGSGCSGSLVAPNIVLSAGHCIDPAIAAPNTAALLGESYGAPVATVPIVRCEPHPQYEITYDESGAPLVLYDVGFCELAEDVVDIPSIPILMGCDVEALAPGGELTIVGYGASAGGYDQNGQQWSEGYGIKRFTTQTIETVDEPEGDIRMVGPESAVCYGDSGGPSLVELSDGTWRIVGVGSTTHPDGPPGCAHGSVYDLVYPHMQWLEDESGVDLTPCHDADGTWNPSEGCDAFPISPSDQGHAWADACTPHAVSGLGQTCGPAFGEDPGGSGGESGGTETGDDPTSGGDELGTDGDGDDDGGDTGGASSGGAEGIGGTGGDEGDSEGSGAVVDELDDGGCGCRSGREAPSNLFWVGLIFGLARAGRRSRR